MNDSDGNERNGSLSMTKSNIIDGIKKSRKTLRYQGLPPLLGSQKVLNER